MCKWVSSIVGPESLSPPTCWPCGTCKGTASSVVQVHTYSKEPGEPGSGECAELHCNQPQHDDSRAAASFYKESPATLACLPPPLATALDPMVLLTPAAEPLSASFLLQVVDKNLWPLKTDGTMREKPRPATPLLEASTSDSRALQGTQRDDRAPSPGLSAETSAQSMSCWKPERCVVPDTRLSMHKDNAGFSGDKTCPLLGDIRPTSPRAPSTQVPKAARASQGQCSVEEPPPVVDLTGEDDEELPSLAFFLDSQHHLLPLRLAQSQVSAEDLPCPAPGKPGRAHKPTSNLGRAFTGPPPPATNSKKQALLADPGPRLNKPCPRAGSKASAEQAPALESVPHCQAHKRKADSWGDINKKMRY